MKQKKQIQIIVSKILKKLNLKTLIIVFAPEYKFVISKIQFLIQGEENDIQNLFSDI